MKSQKLNLSSIFSVLILALLLNSCTKESPIQPTFDSIQEPDFEEIAGSNPEIASDISLQNGVLAFKSVDDFRSTLLALNRMNPKDQHQWEASLGFKSMQHIFNSIVVAEFETSGAHSDLYHSKLQSGLIVTNENNGLYQLNLFNPAYANVLSEEGLVVVENDVYQFTNSALKVWENGDLGQLETLQNTSTSSEQIQVIPMNFQEVALREAVSWSDQCESGDESGMLSLSGFYISDFLVQEHPDIVFVEYFLTAQSMVIDDFGELQYDPNATVRLKGKSEINFTIINGDMVRIRRLMESYDQIYGFGGSFIFIPNESGNFKIGAPWTFLKPADLVRSYWSAQTRLGDGSSFSCDLTF